MFSPEEEPSAIFTMYPACSVVAVFPFSSVYSVIAGFPFSSHGTSRRVTSALSSAVHDVLSVLPAMLAESIESLGVTVGIESTV